MAAGGRSTGVAVVEDDEAVLDSIRVLLETEGYAVNAYPSGRAFLDDLGRAACGALILDLHMPDISGVEAIEALAEAGGRLPVVCITGAADAPEKARALAAGARAVLDKPLDAAALLEAVHAALRKA